MDTFYCEYLDKEELKCAINLHRKIIIVMFAVWGFILFHSLILFGYNTINNISNSTELMLYDNSIETALTIYENRSPYFNIIIISSIVSILYYKFIIKKKINYKFHCDFCNRKEVDALISISPLKDNCNEFENCSVHYCDDCSIVAIEFLKYILRFTKYNSQLQIDFQDGKEIEYISSLNILFKIVTFLHYNFSKLINFYKFYKFLKYNNDLKISIENIQKISGRGETLNATLSTWDCWNY